MEDAPAEPTAIVGNNMRVFMKEASFYFAGAKVKKKRRKGFLKAFG